MGRTKWLLLIPLILTAVYFLGPHPDEPEFNKQLPVVPPEMASLENFVSSQEAAHKVKPDNEARIIWANDSLKQKTSFAILYLHGFSASQEEGDPVHREIARKFGCNLYLSRLEGHGIDTSEPLANMKAEALWESAKQAYAIASRLGEKVIVMGTSTGGTLSLMLTARYPEIYAQVLLSPNIRIFDDNAWLLNNHWGLPLARMIVGSDHIYSEDTRDLYKQYWSYGYRIEALGELQQILEQEMNEDLFERIHQPTLMLYYFKDEVHQDSVVKVDAMLNMFNALGTPKEKKRAVAMPNTGNHVIGSYIKSNDVEGVERQIASFMSDILQMKEADR